jgi:DNA-binding transcriptional ArsR family regulator
MPQGKAIHEDTQWIIIRLSTIMSASELSMYTNVHERTVRRILKRFEDTGGIHTADRSKQIRLNRSLSNRDIEVCPFYILISVFFCELITFS